MRSDAFTIQVNESDLGRVTRLVDQCTAITTINDQASLDTATALAGRVKALINEVMDSRKAAKRPFAAVEQAIDNRADQIASGLQSQDKRIRGLMASYVAQVEAQQKAERERREAQLRAEKERLEKIAAEARAAQLKAEAEARAAKDEAERVRAELRAKRLEEARLDAELDQVLASEVANLNNRKPTPGLVRGGRVNHPWNFKLVDPQEAVRKGFGRCLRFEPDILACRDVVRAQLEREGPDAMPRIPGFEISRETSVSVRASA